MALKSISDFEEEYENSGSDERNEAEVKNIEETFSLAQRLLDTDYLPKLKKAILSDPSFRELEPYFFAFKSLNLFKLGWRFQYGTSKEWAGLCSVADNEVAQSKKKRNLYVSIDFVKHDENWKENATDTILHEIAHAIVREVFYFSGNEFFLMTYDPMNLLTQGHGKVWGFVCKAIAGGSVCDQYYSNAKLKDSFKLYMYQCFNCGNVGYGNLHNFATNCSKCTKPIIIQRNS